MVMKNLTKLYNKITNKAEGLSWYTEGHYFCKNTGEKYGIPLPIVCAILSALSPASNWERNKLETITLIRGARHGEGSFKFTTYGQNVIKATDILEGRRDPYKSFSMKTGAKTYNFFHNLLEPLDSQYVTIDRHAYRIATGEEYISIGIGKYREIADHYRRSADRIGILPCQLQAVLWVWYREQLNKQLKADVPF
jgi:hypothetical protein